MVAGSGGHGNPAVRAADGSHGVGVPAAARKCTSNPAAARASCRASWWSMSGTPTARQHAPSDLEANGRYSKASRIVHRPLAAETGTSTPRRAYSAARNIASNARLCATTMRPASKLAKVPAICSNAGAWRTSAARMPWMPTGPSSRWNLTSSCRRSANTPTPPRSSVRRTRSAPTRERHAATPRPHSASTASPPL